MLESVPVAHDYRKSANGVAQFLYVYFLCVSTQNFLDGGSHFHNSFLLERNPCGGVFNFISI